MKYICALIVVSDIERSKFFYEKILGQKVKYDFGENITFEGDFAIHQKSHFKDLIGNKEIKQGGNNFELYFELDEVDSFAEKLKENSIEFVHEVMEQPWRQKVVRFYDPDKHIIEIGESMEYLSYRLFSEGKSIADIKNITGLPQEYIEYIIEQKQSIK